jgi:hypothetical protein
LFSYLSFLIFSQKEAPMVVSAAKLAANRRNALLSTGPRTREGKARSSKNATKYGLYAHDLYLIGEDKEEFIQFQTELLKDLNPRSVLELQLADQFIAASWKIKRIRHAEAELLSEASDRLLDEPNPALAMIRLLDSDDKTLEKLHYMERRLENARSRALNQLRAAQKNSCTTVCEFTEAVIQRNEAKSSDNTSSYKDLPAPKTPRRVEEFDEEDDSSETLVRISPPTAESAIGTGETDPKECRSSEKSGGLRVDPDESPMRTRAIN